MFIPAYFSRNLQTFPSRDGFQRYQDFNALPTCLFASARYVRDHSQPYDIVQDSEGDPRFILTALAERQRFAGASIFGQTSDELSKRFEALADLRTQSTLQKIVKQLRELRIDWYVLNSATAINWPQEILSHAVFSCGEYQVFQTKSLQALRHGMASP